MEKLLFSEFRVAFYQSGKGMAVGVASPGQSRKDERTVGGHLPPLPYPLLFFG